ncbi:hypothetical protein H6G65_16120 [Microcystis elabens FACHB-917]|nr:hypothetical protein [Microcystis elabens FACHB-917]
MKNILIIGSSHVGALKSGFDHIAIPSSLEVKYCALPGFRFSRLTVSGNYLLYPESDAGDMRNWFGFESFPCLDNFDKILFVHGPCRLQLSLYSRNRRIPKLSSPVVREIVNNIRLRLFASLLDAVGPSKLIYLGSPLLSNASFREEHLDRVPLLDQDDVSEYCLADCIREVCHQTAEDATTPSILLPPQHLLVKHQFNTLDSYIRGGVRVNGISRADGHDADFNEDMSHGNAEYGKEIATHILDCLVT